MTTASFCVFAGEKFWGLDLEADRIGRYKVVEWNGITPQNPDFGR